MVGWIVIGTALAFLLTSYFQSQRKEKRAESAYPPMGQFVDVDGLRIHAVVDGEGPDLVMIHGSSGSTRDFSPALLDRLTNRYRVILLDRPGLGYSDALPPKSNGIFDQARVLQLAAANLGALAPIVLGQSYGGAVALAWAAERPNTLSALLPVSAVAWPWSSPLPWLYRLNTHPLFGPFAILMFSAWTTSKRIQSVLTEIFAPQSVPTGYASYFGPDLSLRRKTLRANALQRARLLSEIKALAPRLNEITVPTEIIHGDADHIVGHNIHAVPMNRDISHSNLTTLPGIGHMPHHVSQDALVETIDTLAARAGLNPAD